MRCSGCKYEEFDYSENYYICWLGIEPYENAKGSCGCKYTQKTLDKWALEQHKAEDDYYKAMSEAMKACGDI